MITYFVIGIIVLIVIIVVLGYRSQIKQAPSPEQLSRLVVSILKRGHGNVE
ncbi:hypothetical protein I6N90_11310 [Paenibacillus sp. GSMTC-2017]|uniref:hypothetical protein n=1 Tax=Paenibacillus sp. GSMTC-2017 TaxID=2794350 RepID=UPI0018D89052|nr:hypothetical protein [Paenibacillus sp. GSMTC-2017]MBH5318396.1 hypothetical protein [Paenibacillus sp. GSMTC-2017]